MQERVSAAKREKLVAKAAADLGFDSDDDVEMAPAPRKKKKVKKSPDAKKVRMSMSRFSVYVNLLRSCRWPRAIAVDARLRVAPRRTRRRRSPRARCVGHFRVQGAAAIVRRADSSIEERKQAPPPKSKDEILKNLVRKQKSLKNDASAARRSSDENEVGD